MRSQQRLTISPSIGCFQDTPPAGLGCPEGAQVSSGVSEVLRALGASLATMWRNHDDRAVRLDSY
jgi:hypothetical protein